MRISVPKADIFNYLTASNEGVSIIFRLDDVFLNLGDNFRIKKSLGNANDSGNGI